MERIGKPAKKEAHGHLSGGHVHVGVCAGGGDGANVVPLAGAVDLTEVNMYVVTTSTLL